MDQYLALASLALPMVGGLVVLIWKTSRLVATVEETEKHQAKSFRELEILVSRLVASVAALEGQGKSLKVEIKAAEKDRVRLEGQVVGLRESGETTADRLNVVAGRVEALRCTLGAIYPNHFPRLTNGN